MPYISVITLILFILVEYVFGPIIVIGLIITFSFVLIRHSLVRKQNKILLLAQMQFNSELEKQIKLRHIRFIANFLKVNNAGTTLLGYQTNELLNQPYYSLIYEEDLEEMINSFHRVKGHSISLEIRAYHKTEIFTTCTLPLPSF